MQYRFGRLPATASMFQLMPADSRRRSVFISLGDRNAGTIYCGGVSGSYQQWIHYIYPFVHDDCSLGLPLRDSISIDLSGGPGVGQVSWIETLGDECEEFPYERKPCPSKIQTAFYEVAIPDISGHFMLPGNLSRDSLVVNCTLGCGAIRWTTAPDSSAHFNSGFYFPDWGTVVLDRCQLGDAITLPVYFLRFGGTQFAVTEFGH